MKYITGIFWGAWLTVGAIAVWQHFPAWTPVLLFFLIPLVAVTIAIADDL